MENTTHILFKTNNTFSDKELDEKFNTTVLSRQTFDDDLTDSFINVSNELIDELKKLKNIPIEDNIEWSKETQDWSKETQDWSKETQNWVVKFSSSLFVSAKSYTDEKTLIEWATKYLFSHLFLLLCASTCWIDKEYTSRLYFDGFDKDRLVKLKILSKLDNWTKNKLHLDNGFQFNKFINNANVVIIKAKYKIVHKLIINLIRENKIENDWVLIKKLMYLCGNINNNFQLNNNNCIELFTYDFSKFTKFGNLYYDIDDIDDDKSNKSSLIPDKLSLIPDKPIKFHKIEGYLGQFLRIIGTRDKSIPPNTLILIRDGHATSPSVYEKKTLIDFIKSKNNIRIGINNEYKKTWHKSASNGYNKGILMGYVTVRNYLEDDKFYASWGKMFTFINNDSDSDSELQAIFERTNDWILSKFNGYEHTTLLSTFQYGLDEYLGCQLGFNNDGLTVQDKGEFTFRTDDIEWHQILWFDGLFNNELLKKYYVSTYNAIYYLLVKIDKLWYDLDIQKIDITLSDMKMNEFVYLLICIRDILNKNKNENKDIFTNYTFIINALKCILNLENNMYYGCINSLADMYTNISIKTFFYELYDDPDNPNNLSDYVSKIIENKNNFKIIKIKDVRYEFEYVNEDLYGDQIAFGLGWQDVIFNDKSCFDYLQKPLKIKVNSILKKALVERQIIEGGAIINLNDIDIDIQQLIMASIILFDVAKKDDDDVAKKDDDDDTKNIYFDKFLAFFDNNYIDYVDVDNICNTILEKYNKLNKNDIIKSCDKKIIQINNLLMFRYEKDVIFNIPKRLVDTYNKLKDEPEKIDQPEKKKQKHDLPDNIKIQLSFILFALDFFIYYIITHNKFNLSIKDNHITNEIQQLINEITQIYRKMKVVYSIEELKMLYSTNKFQQLYQFQPIEMDNYPIFINDYDKQLSYDKDTDRSKYIKILANQIISNLMKIQQTGGNKYRLKYEKYKTKYLALKQFRK